MFDAPFADIVELSGAVVTTDRGAVPADPTVEGLRAILGSPDSVAVAEFAELGPAFPGAHPTVWFYPMASFLVLPDSTAKLIPSTRVWGRYSE